MEAFALKGNIVHAPALGRLEQLEGGFLVVENGVIEGLYPALPERFLGVEVRDAGDCLIVPSFMDLHLHAPQYAMLGMGMDMQLLEWLKAYTFPAEARFADAEYARRIYRAFAADLVKKGTTRVAMFSSVHRESTHVLIEELMAAGVTGYVGKVNMDRNCPDALCETTEGSLEETRRFVEECGRYSGIAPILTPRFIPSCSDALMEGLSALKREYGLKVQSHLCENLDEVRWVSQLHPDCGAYWQAYEKYGMFDADTLMAHCVHFSKEDREAMRFHGVTAVHCPDSNLNLCSGTASVRRMLSAGVNVALGSDIAGGAELSMMRVVTGAVRASKRIWMDTEGKDAFLTIAEAFYLGTAAGAMFFGEKPGFAAGNALNALVLSDAALPKTGRLTMPERLERLLYFADDSTILDRYGAGHRLSSGQ